MPLYSFEDKAPKIAESAWIFPDATIIGDVLIGENVFVGAGAILRGDYGTIEVGEGSAIEEGVIIHARPGDRAVIGRNVTVGHGAMIHNTRIDDDAVIGMRSIISDYSRVGAWAIVGEGALVRNNQEIPPGKLALGVPAEIRGDVHEHHKQLWSMGKNLYTDLAGRYPSALKRLD